MSKRRVINLFSKKTIIQKAKVFEIDPNKTYMVHVPELEHEDINRLKDWLAERGMKANIVFVMAENMQVMEVKEAQKS